MDFQKDANIRVWKYTFSKWRGYEHYHVTLYPNLGYVADLFGYNKGVDDHQKFNTEKEATVFIKNLRSRLKRRNIKLELIRKDISMW